VEIQRSRVITRISNTGSWWGKNFWKLYRISVFVHPAGKSGTTAIAARSPC
jgi:hypothetical protein